MRNDMSCFADYKLLEAKNDVSKDYNKFKSCGRYINIINNRYKKRCKINKYYFITIYFLFNV